VPQRGDEPVLGRDVAPADRPIQRPPQVVDLALQPVQPRLLVRTERGPVSLLGQRQVVGEVAVPRRLGLAVRLQPLPRVLADRRQ
jgi:hypothetical protein